MYNMPRHPRLGLVLVFARNTLGAAQALAPCSEFSGHMFRLKNVHFTSKSISILDVVPRNRITALVVESCSLDVRLQPLTPSASPFWPAIDRVSFTGCQSTGIRFGAILALSDLFFSQPISRFEISSGSELGRQMVSDSRWSHCHSHILDLLWEYSNSSLETYWERDDLTGVYLRRELDIEWRLTDPTKFVNCFFSADFDVPI
jgi:hypothetical protein